MTYPPHPCPKCNRLLEPAGVVTIGPDEFPTYQCDTCLKRVDLFGEVMDVALTFCVGKDGKAFDPGDELDTSN